MSIIRIIMALSAISITRLCPVLSIRLRYFRCYNGNHVGLVQSLLNGCVVAARQYWEAGSILPVKGIRSIYTDIERVESVRRRRILGAEDDATRVTLDKLHLHLKGEVVEVGGIG